MNQTIFNDNSLTNTTTEKTSELKISIMYDELMEQNYKTLSILLYLNDTCYI